MLMVSPAQDNQRAIVFGRPEGKPVELFRHPVGSPGVEPTLVKVLVQTALLATSPIDTRVSSTAPVSALISSRVKPSAASSLASRWPW